MNNYKIITENKELDMELRNLLDNIEDIKADFDIYSSIIDEQLLIQNV